jgi:hypothetical protein
LLKNKVPAIVIEEEIEEEETLIQTHNDDPYEDMIIPTKKASTTLYS